MKGEGERVAAVSRASLPAKDWRRLQATVYARDYTRIRGARGKFFSLLRCATRQQAFQRPYGVEMIRQLPVVVREVALQRPNSPLQIHKRVPHRIVPHTLPATSFPPFPPDPDLHGTHGSSVPVPVSLSRLSHLSRLSRLLPFLLRLSRSRRSESDPGVHPQPVSYQRTREQMKAPVQHPQLRLPIPIAIHCPPQ